MDDHSRVPFHTFTNTTNTSNDTTTITTIPTASTSTSVSYDPFLTNNNPFETYTIPTTSTTVTSSSSGNVTDNNNNPFATEDPFSNYEIDMNHRGSTSFYDTSKYNANSNNSNNIIGKDICDNGGSSADIIDFLNYEDEEEEIVATPPVPLKGM